MRKLLFALAAGSALMMAAPEQVYAGSGVGVRVGPDGIRIGPRERWRGHYASDCRVIKERIVRPNGTVVTKTRRVCD
jgi:hypothetical protein